MTKKKYEIVDNMSDCDTPCDKSECMFQQGEEVPALQHDIEDGQIMFKCMSRIKPKNNDD